ncbi:MAG: hypothetical protein Ct9H300mP9_0210 [Candidatus Neomarinimicrobiota bacterium]|nr:MAG: hypothetical protein Ct9H300mP9_0210 [Candidatus Neomarinimicrobiota bacterium]
MFHGEKRTISEPDTKEAYFNHRCSNPWQDQKPRNVGKGGDVVWIDEYTVAIGKAIVLTPKDSAVQKNYWGGGE